MKSSILIACFLIAGTSAWAQPDARILCYDRFGDEIWEMTGEKFDHNTCKAMLIAGTVGMCFEGAAEDIVELMNQGTFEYSRWQKVTQDSAEIISEDIILYGSFEVDFVAWTRTDNEIFRCPEFNKIKQATTQLADQLQSSTEYAVSRRYREKFGLPDWLKKK